MVARKMEEISQETKEDLKERAVPPSKIYRNFLSSPLFFSCGLFGLAFLVRLVFALQLSFPPLDDPAYYIQAAKTFFSPRPLDFEVSIIWNFQPLFPNVRHPGFDFWMPLTSIAVAVSRLLFGPSYFAAQIPGLVAGSVLPLFAFYFSRRFLSLSLSLGAGLLTVFNPLLVYQAALPDSSMLFAALAGGAVLALGTLSREAKGPRPGTALAFGLLVGLAYLARTPAVFLGLAWLGGMILNLKYKKPFYWRELVLILGGMFLLVGGWSLRNLWLFGFFTSPAGTQSIFLSDYLDLFNFKHPVSFNTWLEAGPGKILGVRIEALGSAWQNVLNLLTPPSAFLGVGGLGWLAYREKEARTAASFSILLFLGLPLIFAEASLHGSFYHSAASLAPFLTAGEVFLLWEVVLWLRGKIFLKPKVILPALLGSLLILNFLLLFISANQAISLHQKEEELYSRISAWLLSHPGGAVITNQPASLNYASGVPSIRLPANEGLDSLKEVARLYQASYLILTETAGLYPALLDSSPNSSFPLVYQGGDFEVFAISP